MHVEDDKRIIEKILNGKTSTFRILVERYQRLVAHIVFRMVPNPVEQEEIAQEVFIKVYQYLATFKFNSRLSTWIGRIAFNTCMNHLRKEKIPLFEDLFTFPGDNRNTWKDRDHSEVLHEDRSDPAIHVEQEERQKKVQAGIAALPVPYRLIITLFHLEELSYLEIAEITGLPEGTIKSHLFRGRKLLKEKLIAEYTGDEIWT
jgi:RNA polymerase sigma factor (sigma-70 family)